MALPTGLCDWNIHPKLCWCTRHLWEAIWISVEGRESAGTAEGDSDKWPQVSAASPAVMGLVGFPAEPHSQQFILSSLKHYLFTVDPPPVWRALPGSWLVEVSFFTSCIVI